MSKFLWSISISNDLTIMQVFIINSYVINSLFMLLDGKFHLLPTGELLIHNLQESDESQSFRCRSMHRLTRQVVVSSPTRLRINCKYKYLLNLVLI